MCVHRTQTTHTYTHQRGWKGKMDLVVALGVTMNDGSWHMSGNKREEALIWTESRERPVCCLDIFHFVDIVQNTKGVYKDLTLSKNTYKVRTLICCFFGLRLAAVWWCYSEAKISFSRQGMAKTTNVFLKPLLCKLSLSWSHWCRSSLSIYVKLSAVACYLVST